MLNHFKLLTVFVLFLFLNLLKDRSLVNAAQDTLIISTNELNQKYAPMLHAAVIEALNDLSIPYDTLPVERKVQITNEVNSAILALLKRSYNGETITTDDLSVALENILSTVTTELSHESFSHEDSSWPSSSQSSSSVEGDEESIATNSVSEAYILIEDRIRNKVIARLRLANVHYENMHPDLKQVLNDLIRADAFIQLEHGNIYPNDEALQSSMDDIIAVIMNDPLILASTDGTIKSRDQVQNINASQSNLHSTRNTLTEPENSTIFAADEIVSFIDSVGFEGDDSSREAQSNGSNQQVSDSTVVFAAMAAILDLLKKLSNN